MDIFTRKIKNGSLVGESVSENREREKKMVFSSSIFLFIFLPILLMLYFCPLIKETENKKYYTCIV